MAQQFETHIRKRGFFGWIFLVLFWAFNALMALWAYLAAQAVSGINVNTTGAYADASRAGTAIGGTIAGVIILFIWVAGAVILGLFVLLSRGRKTIVIRQNVTE